MSKRIFSTVAVSFAAVATGTISAGANHMSMIGSSTTQITGIDEILLSGMAAACTLGAFSCPPIGTGPATPAALASPTSAGPMQSNATHVAHTSLVTAHNQPHH